MVGVAGGGWMQVQGHIVNFTVAASSSKLNLLFIANIIIGEAGNAQCHNCQKKVTQQTNAINSLSQF